MFPNQTAGGQLMRHRHTTPPPTLPVLPAGPLAPLGVIAQDEMPCNLYLLVGRGWAGH